MSFSRILIRAANWIGDAVMSLPALRAIRARFPEAHIAVLARPWVAGLYARERFADQVLLAPTGSGAGAWAGRWRLARRLHAERFDAAILLPNSFESALTVFLAGIPRRIGYRRDGRSLLLTGRIATPAENGARRHECYYYLELLHRAGILDEVPEVTGIRLDAATEARTAGQERFAAAGIEGPVIGVSPGAAFGSAKRWLPERFAKAASQVARRENAAIAVFGSAGERPLCEEVAGRLARAGLTVRNFAGETSLQDFIDLTAACRAFLTNDSGAMHVAYAAGVPTVAVFGPTDHVGTGPVGAHTRIVRHPFDCAPCKLRECPIDHRCMTAVAAGEVAAVTLDLLDSLSHSSASAPVSGDGSGADRTGIAQIES